MQAKTPERLAVIITVCCAIAVAIAYLKNLHSGPFADDFGWVRMGLASIERGWLSIWYDSFEGFFFRPFNVGLVDLSLRVGSWAVAHGAALAVHAVMSVIVGLLARRLYSGTKSRWLGPAAACAFFAHQANVTTVLQIDTLSQATSDLFSVVALLAALSYVSSGRRWLLVAGLSSLLAMLGKESGVSVALSAVVTVFLLSPLKVRIRKALLMFFVQAGALATYSLWRLNVQNILAVPDVETSRYNFSIGLGTLRNLAQFIFVQIVPWNSVSLIADGRLHQWVIGIAIGLLVVLVAGAGWRKLPESRPGKKLLLIWIASVFLIWCMPNIFLGVVSEQMVYRLTVLTAVVISIGCWSVLRSGRRHMALLALIAWCSWVCVGSHASIGKSVLIRHNARVSTKILDDMEAALGDISETECIHVHVVPAEFGPGTYSVLRVPDSNLRFRALRFLDTRIEKPGLEIAYYMYGEEPPVSSLAPPRLKQLRVDIDRGSAELISH
jgi:hypothetical protein